MMTIEEMIEAKQRLHYTNEMISDKSGVPLPTVQKVFSGTTKRPRFKTLLALESVLMRADRSRYYGYPDDSGVMQVKESSLAFDLYGTGNPDTTDMTYPFGEVTEYSEDGLPVHPKYKIPIRKQGDYTTDDLDKIPDEIRVELIDGVIYDLASPTSVHQDIVGTVYMMMKMYALHQSHDCMPYIAPLDVQFDHSRKTRVQPDLIVVCADDEYDQQSDIMPDTQAPDFIMEVLSPSTKRKDMLIKLNTYFRAGVKEYWMVDPDEEIVIVYDFRNNILDKRYTFNDEIPVAISDGGLKIDFRLVKESLETAARIERSRPWEMIR